MEETTVQAYGSFWKIWGILLCLTAIMVFVDVMHMPRMVLLFVLLGAMLVKAFLIATQFMDLKHERLVVGLAIAFSILFFGAFLFAFIAPDGFMVFHGGR